MLDAFPLAYTFFGASFAPETKDFLGRLVTQPTPTRAVLYNNLIKTLISTGIWQSLDAIYLLAATDSSTAILNIKSTNFTAVEVNSPTFTVDRGYLGDGSTSRLRTQFTPSTDGVNFLQDDASLWVWCVTNVAEARPDVGSNSSAPQARIRTNNGSSAMDTGFNDNTLSSQSLSPATSIGLSGVSRASSTTKKLWKNGVQNGSDISVTSTGVSAQEQWICGSNNALFSNKQIAFAAWGNSLTGKEYSFYLAVRSFLQGVGAA